MAKAVKKEIAKSEEVVSIKAPRKEPGKKIPVVSIVGRQNVGKSTLFNSLLKKKLAITEDYPGVTRDVLSARIYQEEKDLDFYLCDTPGLDIENPDSLSQTILEAAYRQLRESDVIVFLLDKNLITTADHGLLNYLRREDKVANKPIIYCVNKADKELDEFDLEEFYRMGLSEVLPISAIGRKNLGLLLEKIQFFLKDKPGKVWIEKISASKKKEAQPLPLAEEDYEFRLAIVGKPNSGKSSLLNAICGYERAVVSDVAGTTRDSIDTLLEFGDRRLLLTDTAGIRKQSKTAEALEFYSYQRTIKAIESSDLVIHLLDAKKGFGDFDKKITSLLQEKGKPFLLAVNKWDSIEDKTDKTFKEYKEKLYSRFPLLNEVPIITISATERLRVQKLIDLSFDLASRSHRKVSTSELNKNLKNWMGLAGRSFSAHQPPKMLYCTQVSTSPFHLILFVNHVEYFKSNLVSFLKKKLTETYDLQGIPIRLEFRSDRK
ncbi:ribosome biogenesis GTPase Der [Leptospira interrogans]|uniref:GTPase Der n=2 Tax=Leptospira interrogans TaxID=173 RepID=A0A0E2D863_LEPIR|nr:MULTISPECIES: ribosome biogenesis GTPase Der [Leptospira]AKH76657.1 GTP-binding protein Der [Leptospira interrogans serovar Bratislava]EJO80469.1 ribosome-associated GTPase EngA [Leptospira interrogans serovar Pomona str. Kennewicki LC82-25]EJP05166.1 ribosome-associated GTPase EngA [Leptospira interrogans serovar Bulgarica str. Mallika]EKN96752.1 ribosome-associated GTPase EngA [Leptospira interrogans serovar Pomona str. Pomona]EKO71818.1 ribosome-associated GTPase EngA [Leptospira interro